MQVALMSHDDRVMHLPGPEHGRAECGEQMRDPWRAGPIDTICVSAVEQCDDCFGF